MVRHQLRAQVDGSLWAQEQEVARTGHVGAAPPGIPASAGGPAQYVQLVIRAAPRLGGLTHACRSLSSARHPGERRRPGPLRAGGVANGEVLGVQASIANLPITAHDARDRQRAGQYLADVGSGRTTCAC